VLFPTPWWHPGRRAKRRLVRTRFLDDVARVLKPNGLLHIATDVALYATAIQTAITDHQLRQVQPDALPSTHPHCHQLSRREWRCQIDDVPVFRWWLAKA
ncbi:MAG: hypothetical protein VX589_01005, partial [Myxococcota bacterium]|nr:hypothetical protein [Myxococcota bacterium]